MAVAISGCIIVRNNANVEYQDKCDKCGTLGLKHVAGIIPKGKIYENSALCKKCATRFKVKIQG